MIGAACEVGAWLLRRRRRFRVQGRSMLPTLHPGDHVLISAGGAVVAGDLVVAAHPFQPVEVVKRVALVRDDGLITLRSDNPAEGSDSKQFGSVKPSAILGVVTLCLTEPTRSLASSSALGR